MIFESSFPTFPLFPCSPCYPCSPNLIHVLQSGIAGFNEFCSPDANKQTKQTNGTNQFLGRSVINISKSAFLHFLGAINDVDLADKNSEVHLNVCLQLCHCCSVPPPQLSGTTYYPLSSPSSCSTTYYPSRPTTGNLLESLKLSLH